MEPPGSTPDRRASLKVLSRNIDQVVLGELCFSTWYYSPYPDSIISSSPDTNGKDIEMGNGHGITTTDGGSGSGNIFGGSKAGITCPTLYICPLCFLYTPSSSSYSTHLALHLHRHRAAGYGDDQPIEPVPDSAFKVYEHGGYSVWEVDGEKEKLYCQNLSLLGKLWLEQKSVFFDTGGFGYYVLTHEEEADVGRGGRVGGGVKAGGKRKSKSGGDEEVEKGLLFGIKVLGFFSKEDLSWDSNNLACILILPPWQKRQLGQLLMGVSYKLSGWEWEGGVIGGPEKPLSSMGKRSYTRFWAERVARYVLGMTEDSDQLRAFEGQSARRVKGGNRREEVSVRELGERTGMLVEDVVCALQEMDVCEIRKGQKRKKGSDEINGSLSQAEMAMMVVSRSRVVEWARTHGVDVVSNVKEEGFLGEWAMSDDGRDSQEEEEDET